MDAAIAWLNAHWWVILIAVVLVLKVLDLITKHWSEHKGLVKWCLFLIDLLNMLKSTPAPKKLVK